MYLSSESFAIQSAYQVGRKNLSDSMKRVATGDPFSVPGKELSSNLSISVHLKTRLRDSEASLNNLHAASNYLNQAEAVARRSTEILSRMTELAAAATDALKTSTERLVLNQEFQSLKSEIRKSTRSDLFQEMQTIGRDVTVSFDANTDKIKFWQITGLREGEVQKDFSSDSLDSHGNLIGFDPSCDFTMGRYGKNLYFLGTDSAGDYRVKKYSIEENIVSSSENTYNSKDKLFIDEEGKVFINDSGSLKQLEFETLKESATLASDLTAETQFSVYKDTATYQRNDSAIVQLDLTGAVPQEVKVTTAQISSAFASSGSKHAVAASGAFIADEISPGSIRLIRTDTNASGNISETVLQIGGADSVDAIQFNEDGDRIYYLNKESRSIEYLNISMDIEGNASLTQGNKIVQGENENSLNGLDLGGANPGSNYKFGFVQGGPMQLIEYEAADLRLYNIGLANTEINTLSKATEALEDIETAATKMSAQRAKLGAKALRFSFMNDGHLEYLQDLQDLDGRISNVDIAKEVSEMNTLQVQNQASAAILAQFNSFSRIVLSLLPS